MKFRRDRFRWETEEMFREAEERRRVRATIRQALREGYDAIGLETFNAADTVKMRGYLRDYGWHGKIVVSQVTAHLGHEAIP